MNLYKYRIWQKKEDLWIAAASMTDAVKVASEKHKASVEFIELMFNNIIIAAL